jgi:hypothetical protein
MKTKGLSPLQINGNTTDNWKRWIQKFEIYATATELTTKPENIQCAQLLYRLGEDCIEIYNSFEFKDGEKDNYNILKKKFEDYFVPKKNLTYCRYKFFSSRQGSESIEQFVTDLRNKARECELGDLQDELIKTMLITGIRDESVREKLIEKDGTSLTLDKAVECCILTENSRKQLHEMKNGETPNRLNLEMVNLHQTTKTSTSSQGQPPGKMIKNCARCGQNHKINNCAAYGKICNICKKKNHFANMCKQKNKSNFNKKKVQEIDCMHISQDEGSQFQYLSIESIERTNAVTNLVDIVINGKFVKCKIDSGADANLISVTTLKELNYDLNKIKMTNDVLVSYTKEKIPIKGKCNLIVQFNKNKFEVEFYVEHKHNKTVIGLRININEQFMTCQNNYKNFIHKYEDVFKGIGKMNKPYHFELKENVKPIISPIRNVPFALRDNFKKCLDELEKNEIIKKVEGCSEWVNSYVLVKKEDGSLRICLDPQHLNNSLKNHTYKIPNIDEIINKLQGSTIFSTLDASSGFWNIPLDESSSKLCTFGTPFGRYRFMRMPFGIKVASEVFQECFHNIFNIPGVVVYVDDILIHAKNKIEHDRILEQVFQIAIQNNIKFNLKKCKFGMTEIKYLGHKFSALGISVDDEKIKAIKDMPSPRCKKDIERFLGLVTYLGRFINNLSEKTYHLRKLLKHDVIFEWNSEQQNAFEHLKNLLVDKPLLQFFDPKKEITISVDASQNGLGAVLLQDNKPCAFASRSMTDTQQRYAQIEKELLAIYFGVTKFYQYIYGRKFNVETDHKPLLPIFKKPLNECPARLQRMRLSLQKYDINLIFKPGKELIIADNLSRATLPEKFEDNLNLELQICLVEQNLKINDENFKKLIFETKNDDELQRIKHYLINGWPNSINKVPIELKPYYKIRSDITKGNNDLIYMGPKIIIPKTLRPKILSDIHVGHLGIKKCIQRAKFCVYWPNITNNIEDYVSKCEMCNKYANSNKNEPMIPHKIIKQPWQKTGMDLFEIKGQIYLIVVDYYSKYPEVINLNRNITSKNIINHLKSIFARHDIPKVVVTDSGTQLISNKMKHFANKWNFQLIPASPKHQQSNGMSERTIQSIKRIIKKTSEKDEDLYMTLLAYRNTPIHEFITYTLHHNY